jgi:CPA2 family monovalent cation:H+ antiporter-2
MESWGLLAQIVVQLAAALVVGGVLAPFNQNPQLGYILAGTLMGSQGGVGLVDYEHGIAVIAEIGVSLLLFSLGLEFSWQRL